LTPNSPEVHSVNDDDNENEGFAGWLRSGEGVEYMKVFVMLNTFMVVLTMSWPHLKNMYIIFSDYVKGE